MKKLGLIMLLMIILLTTACGNGNSRYAFVHYDEEDKLLELSKKNYKDIMKENKTNTFVKLDDEKLSVCIYRNKKLDCFETNNYEEEQKHLETVFGYENCVLYTNSYNCDADDFSCDVNDEGNVMCSDWINKTACSVHGSGYTGSNLLSCW